MKKGLIVSIHVLLWVIYLLLYASIWRLSGMTFEQSLLREVMLLPLKLVLVYTCILYLSPRFLQHKRNLTFGILIIVLIISATFLHNLYIHYVVPAGVNVIQPGESPFDWERMTKRMTYLTSPMFFALTLTMISNWYEQKEQNARITEENLSAKLHLLKQQLQPHFFFNTLNSVYSLALQKSDQTPQMILKLSDLMRYLNDHHGNDWVSLKDEIGFITNYLSLEGIRYQDRVNIDLSAAVKAPEGIFIPPLVLSPFIENAFKHGVIDSASRTFVKVSIREDNRYLYYKVTNNKARSPEGRSNVGSGLANLRSRLGIIYGKDFTMDLTSDENTYTAQLQLIKRDEIA